MTGYFFFFLSSGDSVGGLTRKLSSMIMLSSSLRLWMTPFGLSPFGLSQGNLNSIGLTPALFGRKLNLAGDAVIVFVAHGDFVEVARRG